MSLAAVNQSKIFFTKQWNTFYKMLKNTYVKSYPAQKNSNLSNDSMKTKTNMTEGYIQVT